MPDAGDLVVHRHPQPQPIDCVRWLPSPTQSPFYRFVAAAVYDPVAGSSHLQKLSLSPSLTVTSSTPALPSRVTSLVTSPSISAAATAAGDLYLVCFEGSDSEIAASVKSGKDFHLGPLRGLDVRSDGFEMEVVTAGEDGRVSLVGMGGGGGQVVVRKVWDGKGLVGYTAARWASPAEFAVGGFGTGVQWWDKRQSGGPAAQCKGFWGQGLVSGIVHSIDIHPSRKHICVVGGSFGSVFAWDLRSPQQPIMLSGAGVGEATMPLSESEVWEVQFDSYTLPSGILSAPTKVLPVMLCSEDGYLAIVKHDEGSVALLAEDCAINCFDIDPQNPSDVIFALEWESIGILERNKETMPMDY